MLFYIININYIKSYINTLFFTPWTHVRFTTEKEKLIPNINKTKKNYNNSPTIVQV